MRSIDYNIIMYSISFAAYFNTKSTATCAYKKYSMRRHIRKQTESVVYCRAHWQLANNCAAGAALFWRACLYVYIYVHKKLGLWVSNLIVLLIVRCLVY